MVAHNEKSVPLQDAPLRFTILPPREALQGLPVQRLGVSPVMAASDYFSVPKVHNDQLAHLSVLKPAPQRSVSVIHQ
jgi:hypothetical protein